jgi:2-haloacid dehalogenase
VSDRWASFDCYGTLIDWMSGIRSALAEIFPGRDTDELLERYHDLEPLVEAGGYVPYREVMDGVVQALGVEENVAVAPKDRDALGRALPGWPVFPEVPDALREAREQGWKLAILSNTDPDLLAASIDAIGVEPDEVVVAKDAGSYKPALGHWEVFFERTGAAKDRHVHVAASLRHDVEPCAALGLACVWINRLNETSAVPRAGTLPDLSTLPSTLAGLVPLDPSHG